MRKWHQMITQGHYTVHKAIIQCSVGRDGALVESITFNRRVVGSTPALAVT